MRGFNDGRQLKLAPPTTELVFGWLLLEVIDYDYGERALVHFQFQAELFFHCFENGQGAGGFRRWGRQAFGRGVSSAATARPQPGIPAEGQGKVPVSVEACGIDNWPIKLWRHVQQAIRELRHGDVLAGEKLRAGS